MALGGHGAVLRKWMVLFCPKWFEPCQKVEPEFEELARKWQRELLVGFKVYRTCAKA